MSDCREALSEEDAIRVARKMHDEIINIDHEAALDEYLKSTAETSSSFKDVLEPLLRMEVERKIAIKSIRCDANVSEEQYLDGFIGRLHLELLTRRAN